MRRRYSAGMRAARCGLILVILLLPSAAAQFVDGTNEGAIETHPADTFIQSRASPPAGQIFSRTIDTTDPLPWYDTDHRHYVVTITYMATIESSADGVWQYTFTIDGVEMENCRFNIATIDPPGLANVVLVYPSPYLVCRFDVASPELTSVVFNASRTAAGGSPNIPEHETISYRIDGYYHLEPLMPTPFEAATNMTAAEFLVLPLFAMAGAYLWSRKDPGMSVLGSLLMLFASIWSTSLFAAGAGWRGSLVLALVFLFAFGYMVWRNTTEWKAKRQAKQEPLL